MKTIEVKIQELKMLRIAYLLAINYDYVPDVDNTSEVFEYIEKNLSNEITISEYDLAELLKKYQTYDDGALSDLINDKINEL